MSARSLFKQLTVCWVLKYVCCRPKTTVKLTVSVTVTVSTENKGLLAEVNARESHSDTTTLLSMNELKWCNKLKM